MNYKKIIKEILKEKIEYNHGDYFNKYVKDTIEKRDILIKSTKKFKTPQYILNEEKLKDRALFFMNTFRKFIPNSEFFYAFKCNDFPALIKALKNVDYNADVASLFELKLALKLGFEKIIFSGPGKDKEELELAIKNKVIINIDNIEELGNILKLNKKANISIRINPDPNITKRWSKFGFELDNLKTTINKIKNNQKLLLKGIHFHCSWNDTPNRYIKNIRLIGKFLKNNNIPNLEFLDIGGGFYPEDQAILAKEELKGNLISLINEYADKEIIPFDPHKIIIEEVEPLEKFAQEIALALKKNMPHGLKIYLEPGRFITIHSTAILLKVVSVKEKGVIVDGGINLIGDYRFAEYSFVPIVNLSNPSFKLKKKIIYGPLCDPSDLWGHHFFGHNIKRGDILAVLNQGAYTFSCAWRFIKPTAPYIVMSNKRLILGKEKEKFEDRYSGCKI